MKNVFKKPDTLRSKRPQHQYNLAVPRPNYYEFGTKCLTSLRPKVFNSLPVHIKSAEIFETWDGEMCKCRIGTYDKNY